MDRFGLFADWSTGVICDCGVLSVSYASIQAGEETSGSDVCQIVWQIQIFEPAARVQGF